MKIINYFTAILLLLLFSCSSDNGETVNETSSTTFMMDVTWKGNIYHVKSTYDKEGNLVYLDDSFLSIYNNEILKNDSIITYDAGEKKLAYYTSVDEMMHNLGLRFLDVDSLTLSSSGTGKMTRTISSDAYAGRATLYQHLNYLGQVLELGAQYTKFRTIPVMSREVPGIDWNDKASSIIVYSNIPLNDSVYANWSDINLQYESVSPVDYATMGNTKYATNDLRVVFLGYEHKNYGGDVMCIVPDNCSAKQHNRLGEINWNDRMSSCTLRLAIKDLYSDSPSDIFK